MGTPDWVAVAAEGGPTIFLTTTRYLSSLFLAHVQLALGQSGQRIADERSRYCLRKLGQAISANHTTFFTTRIRFLAVHISVPAA